MLTTQTCSQKAGANLKRFIKEGNLTQEKFAEKVGCDVRTVRRWISDFDSISNISYAAKALGKNVTDFLV